MYKIRVQAHIDSAHHLTDYEGKCCRLHGHRWTIEVCVVAARLGTCNMAVDFTAVKGALKILEDSILDHTDLNAALKEENPTAEFLAQWVYKHLSPSAVQWGVSLASVRVWESPECSVEYTPDVFMWDVQ